jgi:hypothetical protein
MNLARLNRTETFTTKDTKFTKFKSINVRTLRELRLQPMRLREVRPRELVICPRSDTRHPRGVTQEVKARM